MEPTQSEIDFIFDTVLLRNVSAQSSSTDTGLALSEELPIRQVNLSVTAIIAIVMVDGHAELRRHLIACKRHDLLPALDAAVAEDAIMRGRLVNDD